MHGKLNSALLLAGLSLTVSLHAANISFRGPLAIAGIPRPVVTVHAGNLNGDDRLDLIASHGTGVITVLFQDPADRSVWTQVPVRVGASCFFTRAGDFDGDGIDDLVVADGASTAYYVRSNGDGTFAKAMALPQARGARWIATGDWNRDGSLDLASSNLNSSTLTIFVTGRNEAGDLVFTLTQNPASGREHTLEALDFDGDGFLDLSLGTGLPGIQLHKGQGDGKFVYNGRNVGNLGCVEYIATGDFDEDGKGDISPTCIDDGYAYVGLSQGNGTYRQVIRAAFATGTESSAIGDMNGDSHDDLALVSAGGGLLRIYLGKGDGTFDGVAPNWAPVDFGPTGAQPVFLIAEDLDVDGHTDVVSADSGSASLTIFYGRDGERFFESADSITGYQSAQGFEVVDFDKNGAPDLICTGATSPAKAYIYLNPGGSSPTAPTYTVPLANRYTSSAQANPLAVGDLDGDQTLDLAGVGLTADAAYTALLNPDGTVKQEASFLPCDGPQAIRIGRLDGDSILDFVVTCSNVNQLTVYLGTGGGQFQEPRTVPSVEKVRFASIEDVDRDGSSDVVVWTSKVVAVHYGLGTGEFTAAVPVAQEPLKVYLDAVVTDLTGDGINDMVIAESRGLGILIYHGKPGREFDVPEIIRIGFAPTSVEVVDVDGDGLLDITTGSTSSQAVNILFNLGLDGFGETASYRAGLSITTHKILDLDLDGVMDILALGGTGSTIRRGYLPGPPPPPRLHRGDADGNGRVQINDPVTLLNWLFRPGAPLSCEDGADADDDSTLNITDALIILQWLFQQGQPPAAPGPRDCGEDPTLDELRPCKARC